VRGEGACAKATCIEAAMTKPATPAER
jgi:hypothetical protein